MPALGPPPAYQRPAPHAISPRNLLGTLSADQHTKMLLPTSVTRAEPQRGTEDKGTVGGEGVCAESRARQAHLRYSHTQHTVNLRSASPRFMPSKRWRLTPYRSVLEFPLRGRSLTIDIIAAIHLPHR